MNENILLRQLAREKRARKEAESITEQKSLQLYNENLRLQKQTEKVTQNEEQLHAALETLKQHQKEEEKNSHDFQQSMLNILEDFNIEKNKVELEIVERRRAEMQSKESEMRLELALNSAQMGTWEWDIVHDNVIRSLRHDQIFGYKSLQPQWNKKIFLSHILPEDREVVEKNLAEAAVTDALHLECRIIWSDKSIHWIYMSGHIYHNRSSGPVMIGVIMDYTRNKLVEEQLKEDKKNLERINAELDNFAYAASHDLKAPLRVIDNTSKWLEEDLQEVLTDEAHENLNLMRGRVMRMESLLDDLLEYCRIGRAQDERFLQIVSGDALVQNVLELLPVPKDFEITVDPHFSNIQVNRMPLQQILMNLIENAIKHHDKKKGHIDITVKEDGAYYIFAVKDDGPGIAEKYHEQIFKIFQTLKPKDQVEGSGMGLAMVRKNIDLFGGKLTLLSSEGKGSTFSFTWPKKQYTNKGERT